MGQDTFYELSRRSIIISRNEETTLAWNNSFLTVRTDKGINFFKFSNNLQCLDKKLDFFESSTITPKNSPASDLFKGRFLKQEMKNIDMTDMILNSVLWPHNQQLTQEMTGVNEFSWSPQGFLHNEGTLAILNDIGGVSFFVKTDYDWESILDLSTCLKQLEHNRSPKTFEELRESVYTLVTSAICWSPNINTNNSCYFVTAQRNGTMLFWLTQSNTETRLTGRFEITNNSEITGMIWIPKTNETFLLICANIIGQIFAYECMIENGEIKLNKSHTLWQYKDRMIARNLTYTTINNTTVFICSKHRHLLVQTLDNNCKVVHQHLENINDQRITCITKSIEGIYFTTVDIKMFILNITLTEANLKVDRQTIEFKETYSTHELYSIGFSSNNVILALGMIDRKVLCRKDSLKLDILFMSTEKKFEMLVPKLMSVKSFANHWDCVEGLRYKIIKHKKFSQAECDLINTVKNDTIKLKLCFILVTICNSLKGILYVKNELNIPYTSIEMIMEKILALKAASLITDLHGKYQNDKTLTNLEDESFVGARKYLEYYCKKYENNITEFIDQSMCSITNSDYEYICQCCDEKIEGFTCKDGHPNAFCSQTFTQIVGNEYLACKACNYIVRLELSVLKPMCLYCDIPLCNTVDQIG